LRKCRNSLVGLGRQWKNNKKCGKWKDLYDFRLILVKHPQRLQVKPGQPQQKMGWITLRPWHPSHPLRLCTANQLQVNKGERDLKCCASLMLAKSSRKESSMDLCDRREWMDGWKPRGFLSIHPIPLTTQNSPWLLVLVLSGELWSIFLLAGFVRSSSSNL
jgi:hypothetical protein